MSDLRSRIHAGEPVLGTFIKTPTPHVAELLGLAGLDFAVVDREHAPIGIEALDLLVIAARSVALPLLVRVPSNDPVSIASALDAGAEGILVPHVRNAAEASAVVQAAKYSAGHRGFSPSARAGMYGTQEAAKYRSGADARSVLIVQIEDVIALDHLDEIASISEIDALFIGPADLALSIGCGPNDSALADAINLIVAAGKRNAKPVAIFTTQADQIPSFLAKGISIVVCGSDQSMIIAGGRQISGSIREKQPS